MNIGRLRCLGLPYTGRIPQGGVVVTPVHYRAAPAMNYSNDQPLSNRKQKMSQLRTIMKEYGAVGVAFHTTISLASLGTCYMIIKSGVDVEKVFQYFNIDSTKTAYKTASTMGVAYVLHKIFLPVRAVVTITCVPLMVRYLRAKGIMKPPVHNKTN